MESFACEEVAPCPALGLASAAARPRHLAVGFRFDNPPGRERPRPMGATANPGFAERRRDGARLANPRKVSMTEPGPPIAVPAYSRIVYQAGAVRIR